MKLTNRVKATAAALMASASFLTASTPAFAAEKTESSNSASKTASYMTGLAEMTMDTTDNELKSKTGLVKIGDETYFLNQFGDKETGLQEEDGKKYFFNEDGSMAVGFVEIDGDTYYFSKHTGEMKTGRIEVQGKAYYLQDDGVLLSGWQNTKDGKTYYNSNGSQAKDEEMEIDGNRYAFDENGIMLTNVTLNGYNYDENGIGTPDKSAYQRIADAALAQIGVYQDCTMLVTNSLKAVGINFHGWPEEYLSLGPTTNNPVPGDIIVYSGHVAIYVGDGMAVHGGWNGVETRLWTVECSNPFIAYVHPIIP